MDDRNNRLDAEIEKLSGELTVVADRNRLAILKFLKRKETASVGRVADNLKISFKATSKHLLFLVKKRILQRQKDGPFVMYHLSPNLPKSVREILRLL